MAAYWIKVCKDTIDKPKLNLIARLMGISRDTAFVHFFRLYAWADGQTEDGIILNISIAEVAELSKVPLEFCQTLGVADIAWLVPLKPPKQGVQFRNWHKHNGECAKKREMTAQRVARLRGRKKVTL
jgi:hypothetical protein